MYIRAATIKDIDALVALAVKHGDEDPVLDFLYPRRNSAQKVLFLQPAWKQDMEKYVKAYGYYLVVVYEKGGSGAEDILIAYGLFTRDGVEEMDQTSYQKLWESIFPDAKEQKDPRVDKDCTTAEWTMLGNSKPFEALRNDHIAVKETIIRGQEGLETWWALEGLVTHTDHRRKGAAGMIVNWGQEQVKGEQGKSALWLEAVSSLGEAYSALGFQTLDNRTINCGDGTSMDKIVCIWSKPC